MFEIKTNPALCQNINQIHLQLIYYGRAQVDIGWKGRAINPVHSRLFYIVSGQGLMIVNKTQEIILEAGNWYFFPAGCPFEYSCDNKMDHIYFHFNLCGIDGIDLFHQYPTPVQMKSLQDDVDFFTRGLDCRTVFESLLIRQRVYDILLTLMNKHNIALASRKLSPCVAKAIKYIRSNLSVQLTTGEIAEQAGVSVSTLTKRFSRELFMSVHEYIDNLVFSEAARLLRESDQPVINISEMFGFCDQFYFSRRFKEKIGAAPRNYRKTFV